ncbi:Hypothetical predicted protein [Olea europaea subsp. europaea]|uniref:Uncharacterized protein n=1 Tax=Olea europaea subsp. europaea TaxID=158383 RepID=A0A8S0S1R9_OLEEU|nr:Hypothetical predicted protein [Olea europaea subsp. europaea]
MVIVLHNKHQEAVSVQVGSRGPQWQCRRPHQINLFFCWASFHSILNVPTHVSAPAMGSCPSQENYNYGQPQGADYGQPDSYSQTPVQHYGHGYGEVKCDHHASAQHYKQMVSQPIVYAQGGTHPGYAPQDQYGKAPTYDGYSHPSPATASSAYPQQAAQPVAGYGLPGGPGLAGGYPYRTPQPGYTEKPAANNAAYGYQAQADLAYGSAQAPSAYAASTPGRLGYGQLAPTQPGYDQPIPQPAGAYAGVPMATGYGKSASPQPVYPRYNATQTCCTSLKMLSDLLELGGIWLVTLCFLISINKFLVKSAFLGTGIFRTWPFMTLF